MKSKLLVFLCTLGFIFVEGEVDIGFKASSSKDNSEVESSETFVATSEWQKVKKGQPIPRGLHVRMNINTGETEAKLLHPNEHEPSNMKARTDLVEVPRSEIEGNVNEESESNIPYMTKDELRSFLSKEIFSQQEEVDETRNEEEIKNRYKSYDDLKKEFRDMDMAVKTEAELVSELVASGKEKLTQEDEPEAIANVLTDLEYLVHQIDNAQEFVRVGGLTSIILPALNSSAPRVRSEALWLLGSASQSNPKVQIAILNAGIIHKVLRVAALDYDDTVRAKAMYALSCLTRRFPSAQLELVKEGGLSIIGNIFDSEHNADLKTKMKVLTLLNDLILERLDVRKEIEELSLETQISNGIPEVEKNMRSRLRESQEKLRQYEAINLEMRLEEEGWCSRLPKFLSKLQENEANPDRTQKRNDYGSVVSEKVPYRPEHDDVEKVLNTIFAMSDLCFQHFRDNSHLEHTLRQMLSWYEELSSREEIIQKRSAQDSCSGTCDNEHSESLEHDLYYSNMAKTLNDILRLWRNPEADKIFKRDEL